MVNTPTRHRILIIGIVLSIAALFLFGSGFVLALGTMLEPGSALRQADGNMLDRGTEGKTFRQEKRSASEMPRPWPQLIVALGDSLARGIGDDGTGGFVGRLRKLLPSDQHDVPAVINLAVSGATSKDLLQKLSQPGVSETVGQADLLLVSIGGNDAFPDLAVLDQVKNDRSQHLEVERMEPAALDAYHERLDQAVKTLRSYNHAAPIFLIGLYDPFYDVQELRRVSLSAVHAWNGVIEAVAAVNEEVYVVPTYDIMQLGGSAYLSGDHFHPSALGYAAIADRLLTTVKTYAILHHR